MPPAAPLHGTGVLVTRPEQQAGALCRLFEAQGATVYRLPALAIVEHPRRREQLEALRAEPDPDLVLFTSANAVRFGEPVLGQRRELQIAAIGPATARALNQAGYRIALVPAAGFDSESLLALPRLANLSGRRVLLVKGEGGRDLLEPELRARGAIVRTLAVYKRRAATPAPQRLRDIEMAFAAGRIQIITATSLDVVHGLLGMASPALRRHFEQATWVSPGARVSEGLGAALSAPVIRAASAENQDLLDAVLRWRASVSSA